MATGHRVVLLVVEDRRGCPARKEPDPEGGWGPQVPTCEHPEQKARGGDYWCPDAVNELSVRFRDPFPPTCPLRDGEAVRLRR